MQQEKWPRKRPRRTKKNEWIQAIYGNTGPGNDKLRRTDDYSIVASGSLVSTSIMQTNLFVVQAESNQNKNSKLLELVAQIKYTKPKKQMGYFLIAIDEATLSNTQNGSQKSTEKQKRVTEKLTP